MATTVKQAKNEDKNSHGNGEQVGGKYTICEMYDVLVSCLC